MSWNTTLLGVVCLAVATIMPQLAMSDEPQPGKQVEQQLRIDDDQVVPYLLYLPEAYEESDEPLPLVLFLHGRGESYGDLRLVEKWGPPRMAARGEPLPFVLVAPQCPKEESWSDEGQQAAVMQLVDHVQQNFRVDATRTYATGLSMGGYGCWKLAADHADRFAAMVIVCGGGDPSDAAKMTELPIWVFHGTEDRAVPIARSQEMVWAIRAAGGEQVRFTILDHIGHNSWSAAYATPEVYGWMLGKTE